MASPGSRVQHFVIAADDAGAVEWTLEGSWLAWRPLQQARIAARLAELLGPAEAPQMPGRNALTLPTETASRLLAGTHLEPGAELQGLPAELLALSSEDHRCWLIRARGTDPVEAPLHTIALASANSAGVWRFSPEGDRTVVTPTTIAEIEQELTAALGV